MSYRYIYRLSVLLCSLLIVIPIGCQTNDKAARDQTNQETPGTPKQISHRANDQTNDRMNNRTNDQTGVNRNQNQIGTPQAQKTAKRLVKLATSVKGVKGATAVVVGRYTIVGIDVDSTIDRNRVGTIKYSVAQALKDDPQGANALVTADTDIVQRLREISKQMAAGKPITGIVDELAAIAGRIAPQPSKGVPNQDK